MFSLLLMMSMMNTAQSAPQELVITRDTTLDKSMAGKRLIIKASHVTLEGNGITLLGPGITGKPDTYKGTAILAQGCSNVTLRGIKAKGFAVGLSASDGEAWKIENCDFSDNYHDPEAGWGNGPRQGGLILDRISHSVLRNNKANRVWNGLDLDNCHDNEIAHNDFSHCSNVCLKMQTACRNTISDNDLSYGIRIKPGEVHARDSTSVLMESGSNDNKFLRNDVRYGGDGIFIRVLNNWVSTGNLFVENDCSYANNNCFEAWSPGNTYLRNKANHGSYGFWLGASDQTILIGNEAAYNGLPTGRHNAPEPDFAHGGIVFVNGPSSHTVVEGNFCHHNGGGGIVLRGDRESKGEKWKAFHWIIQNNRLENNRWGIFAKYADWMHVANNTHKDNAEPDVFDAVTNLSQANAPAEALRKPLAIVTGPEFVLSGQPVVFDASASADPSGHPLAFRWDTGDTVRTEAKFTHTFVQPGYYRVGVTVSNGVLADIAWRDVIVSRPVAEEFGTEGKAALWGYSIEGDPDGRARLVFAEDTQAAVGRNSLRLTPQPYLGLGVTALYPAAKDAQWDLSGKSLLTFWIRAENPNPTGFQGPGPIVRLIGAKGEILLAPVKGGNLLRDGGYSEARWTWLRMVIPLAGSAAWERKDTGTVSLRDIHALSFTFDSWEAAPFTIWVDGIAFE